MHYHALQHTPHSHTLHTLQYTATHCNTLQHTAIHCHTLQYTTTYCSTIPRTAIHCHTLQYTAAQEYGSNQEVYAFIHARNTLQHAATHCHTLHYTTTHCNTPPHTATHCHALQYTTTHYNTRVRLKIKSVHIHHRRRRYGSKWLCFPCILVPITYVLREWDQRITPECRGSWLYPELLCEWCMHMIWSKLNCME